MRATLLPFLLPLAAAAQPAADALEIAQRFADAGAWQAALARVDRAQPRAADGPRWADWEQLRCSLMFRVGRGEELAARVAALPAGVPSAVARSCRLQAARAAVAAGRSGQARDLLARLLWQGDAGAGEVREARLLVIESYLAEGRPRDAYALMLRYQQDYAPLDRDTAARFVDALLAADMQQEAVNWLAQLDETSPVKLLLRLQTNLVAADAAVVQARAALARGAGANAGAYWKVIRHAAVAQRNPLLQVEATENLLQLAPAQPAPAVAALAGELWKSYFAAARQLADRESLLVGDEAGWSDFAARRAGASPATARSFHAFLTLGSRQRASAEAAQLQLAYSLQESRLPLVAVRLFADAARFPVAQIDPQARFLLGSMAAESGEREAAARFWSGLSAPPNLDADEWRLRLAQSLVGAGAPAAGADALRALLADRKSLAPEPARRALAVINALHDGGQLKTADELYARLLPLAQGRERREVLAGLGRSAEAAGDFARAADHFLEAALTGEGRPADTLAIDARIAAAANLARAGLREDARAQYDWLMKNLKDAEKREVVRRAMEKP